MNYFMQRTNNEVKAKGESRPTLCDLLPIVFSVVICYKPPMNHIVAGGLKGIAGVREELNTLVERFDAKKLDLEKAETLFEEFDREHADTRAVREKAFEFILDCAASLNKGTDFVSSVDMWDAIVAYPSVSFKKIVLGVGDGKDEEPPIDKDKFWASIFTEEGGDPSEKPEVKPAPVDTDETDSDDDGDSEDDPIGDLLAGYKKKFTGILTDIGVKSDSDKKG